MPKYVVVVVPPIDLGTSEEQLCGGINFMPKNNYDIHINLAEKIKELSCLYEEKPCR
jgi:hypothetical protein